MVPVPFSVVVNEYNTISLKLRNSKWILFSLIFCNHEFEIVEGISQIHKPRQKFLSSSFLFDVEIMDVL
jgi:hypothetical protein